LEENFDRFTNFFETYKEKEMADFRRWILVLTVLALCVAGANAQVGSYGASGNGSSSGSQLSCTANSATVTPQLRSEGITELVGDIVLICSGGPDLAVGAAVPQVSITVYLNTNITSRLLGNGSVSSASEAVLLLDEPNSGLQGYGPQVNYNVCTTPATGCTATVGTVSYTNPVSGVVGTYSVAQVGGLPAPNVYQGVVASNSQSITFNGVPILPPGSTGISRYVRITNIRVNATAVSAGATTPGYVTAYVASVPNQYLPVVQSQITVGYVQPSLTTSLRSTSNSGSLSSSSKQFNQCSGTTSGGNGTQLGILRYQSNWGGAFKTRVLASQSLSGQDGTDAIQNVPGSNNNANSESGLILNKAALGNITLATGAPAFTGLTGTNSATAGLADFGTRFQAVFNNIPSGVSIFVGTANLVGGGNVNTMLGVTGGGGNAPGPTNITSSYAQLIVSATSPENGNTVPYLTATGSNGGSTWVQFTPAAGTNSVTAVWEVVNSNTQIQNQNFDFPVYISYSSNVSTNTPPAPSTITVSMSYAPLSTTTTASSLLGNIPRFVDNGSGDNQTLAQINICTTSLLFPYITTVTGFDTGLAISNTSMDPFGTTTQAGACTLYWYGNNNGGTTNTPLPNSSTASCAGAGAVINAGTTWTCQASSSPMVGQGFTGYMIATCNFQYAHGYAAVTDIGSRNILTAYLALVMNTSSASSQNRGGTAESYSH
jgi:hypothetical protein